MAPKMTISAVQEALFLMGDTHQHMAQERHKWILMNLNPALKSMAHDEKVFRRLHPCCLGTNLSQASRSLLQVISLY